MDKLGLILQEMVFLQNENLYGLTMKHPSIGKKSDVIAVSMATMTFQHGAHISFKVLINPMGFY